MSFKCYLDIIAKRCILATQLKVYDEAFFAKIVNDFQPLTTFAKKASSQMFEWVQNRLCAMMSEAYLESSQKSMVEPFCKNS